MVYLCESVCFSFINVHTTCQCTCIYWELGQYILSQWNHAQPCGQWRHSITWYINYQVRFFNLTLSAGVVCVCVVCLLPLGLSFWKHLQSCSCGQMVTMGYISDHAEGFFKIFIFTPFFGWKTVKKWPKNDIFALSAGAFFPEATYRHIFGIKW